MTFREIGSEFWQVPTAEKENGIFPENIRWFASGRNALKWILSQLTSQKYIAKAALPSWCCGSMVLPFIQYGIEVVFYPVIFKEGEGLIQDISAACDCDVLLMMDYFGYESKYTVEGYRGIIIRDLTHSIFSDYNTEADFYFGSLRKWAGFLTGGFAWTKWSFCVDHIEEAPGQYIHLRKKAMNHKSLYMGRQREDKGYLSVFSRAEEMLDDMNVSKADPDDIRSARYMDISFITNRRRENAERLLKAVSQQAIFPKLNEKDCPLFVPIRLPQSRRDGLRRYLIEHRVYCPIHWPIEPCHHLTPETETIYHEELSLVCDQRYSTDDMDMICNFLEEYLKK